MSTLAGQTGDFEPLTQVQMCVCNNLRMAARALTRAYEEAIQPTGIRGTQFSLLVVAAKAERPTIAQMAEKLVMDRTTLARNLKPLETAGLVRIEAGTDRREHRVAVTPAGQRALAEAQPRWEAVQTRLVAALGRERAARLLADLAAVVEVSRDG